MGDYIHRQYLPANLERAMLKFITEKSFVLKPWIFQKLTGRLGFEPARAHLLHTTREIYHYNFIDLALGMYHLYYTYLLLT